MNWNSQEIIKRENLNEYYWYQSFFHFDFGKNNYYRRDFNELKYRDLALFSLGSINSKSIIDIGCGTGLYVLTFLKLGAKHVAGQDISESSVEETKKTCLNNGYLNFEIKTGDCQKLQFDNNMFDIAFSGDVFEHITYKQKRIH